MYEYMNKYLNSLILIFLLIAGPIPCHSKDGWRFWSVTDGLAASRSEDLAVAPNGRIWANHGTLFYMSTIDGFECRSISNPWARYLHVEAGLTDDVWTVNSSNILHYKNGVWHEYPFTNAREIVSFIPYQDNRVLFALQDRLIDFDSGSQSATPIFTSDDIQLGPFQDTIRTPDGIVWVSCDYGLLKLEQNIDGFSRGFRWKTYKYHPLNVTSFRILNFTPDNNLIGLADSETQWKNVIVSFDTRKKQFVRILDWNDRLTEAWQDSEGYVWFHDSFNLFKIVAGEVENVEQEGVLVGEIFDVEVDEHGMFSLATSEGVARYIPAIWNVPAEVQHINTWVHAIREDHQGRIWFLSDQKLICFDNQTWHLFPLPEDYSAHRHETEDLCILPDNRLVFNTGNHSEFMVFDPEKKSFDFIHHPDNIGIRIIAPRQDGTVWVRMKESGSPYYLGIFDGTDFQPWLTNEGKKLRLGRVRCVYESSCGDIWIGSLTSLGRVHEGVYTEMEPVPDSPGISTLYIH